MIFSGIALYAKDKIVIHSVGGYGHLNPYEIQTATAKRQLSTCIMTGDT